jgi:hypothetical protein
VQLTPLSTYWAPRKKNKKGIIFFGHPVYNFKMGIEKKGVDAVNWFYVPRFKIQCRAVVG